LDVQVEGDSGGHHYGIKEGVYEVEDTEVGEFYTSMVLRNRVTNFRWELISVYGATLHNRSIDFIAELSRKCLFATLSLVFSGDFNLIRVAKDKSNGNINQGLVDRFNMFIDLHELKEIRRSGLKYSWTNKQKHPTMETLDRILVTTEWETKFPLCFAWSKTRVGSDHWPIFLDSGDNSQRPSYFYFEKQWLLEEGFLGMMTKVWQTIRSRFLDQRYSLNIWQGCLSSSR
jgi:hypothetical protein